MNKILNISSILGLASIGLLVLADIVFRLGIFSLVAAGIGILLFLFKR